MGAQNAAHNILIDLNAKGQCDLLCDSRATPIGLRRFISTIASMSSFEGPFGPGVLLCFGENSTDIFASPKRGGNEEESLV
jgi:hypothetical protein